MNSYNSQIVRIHTIYMMMWNEIERLTFDTILSHISNSGSGYQQGVQTGGAISYSRECRLWGGAFLDITDVWIQWWRWSYGVWIQRQQWSYGVWLKEAWSCSRVKKETPPGGVMADGQKYARGSFPKKIGALEFVQYIRRKDDCHIAAHSTVGEEHKKYK